MTKIALKMPLLEIAQRSLCNNCDWYQDVLLQYRQKAPQPVWMLYLPCNWQDVPAWIQSSRA